MNQLERIMNMIKQLKMENEKCKFCNSTELVYHYYLCDSKCQDCGEWQEGEELNLNLIK